MVKLRSPRVIAVRGVVTTDPTWLGLVVEFMAGGTLREAIDRDDYDATVDEAWRRGWLRDVALGLDYLYARGVEHRDLKTLNVLLDDSRRRCKVTDFGLSKSEELNTALTQSTMGNGAARGTPSYMAPELLESNTFTEKTDVYSFALIIWEVLSGAVPWAGLMPMQVSIQVLLKQARPPEPEGAPADLVALMTRCWAQAPDARPTFAEVKLALAKVGGIGLAASPSTENLAEAEAGGSNLAASASTESLLAEAPAGYAGPPP